MGENFPIEMAQLMGNWFETLFYGMYLVSCAFVGRSLLLVGREERWRKPNEIRWMMLSVAIALFLICTFDTANGLYHNIMAFVLYKGPGGPARPLSDIGDWVNIARSIDQVLAMVIGDFVLIYRCYIVYARRWLIVLPSLLLYLGGVAMAIKLIQAELSLSHAGTSLLEGELQPWWRAFFAITAVQNGMTTGLLIWRIWRVERQLESFRTSRNSHSSGPSSQPRLRKVIRTIAESGAMYTLLVVITFIVSTANSLSIYPTSDATLVATGIAFNVIIVRSSPAREEEFTHFDNQERTMAEQGGGSNQGYGMNSLNFVPGKKGTAGTGANIVSFKSDNTDDTAIGGYKKRYSGERSTGPMVSVQTERWVEPV